MQSSLSSKFSIWILLFIFLLTCQTGLLLRQDEIHLFYDLNKINLSVLHKNEVFNLYNITIISTLALEVLPRIKMFVAILSEEIASLICFVFLIYFVLTLVVILEAERHNELIESHLVAVATTSMGLLMLISYRIVVYKLD